MVECYQNSNERNRTAARFIHTYIHYVKCACIYICKYVWLFVCTFSGVRVLKYTRDAILYALHIHIHTFAGTAAAWEKRRKKRNENSAFCRWRRRAPPHTSLITRLSAQLLATQFVTRQHRRLALFAQHALSCLKMRRILFMYSSVCASVCVCVFIVLVSLFVYTGA